MPHFFDTRLSVYELHLTLEHGIKIHPLSQSAHNHALDLGTCAAIGSFDGVHIGHQRVIATAQHAAQLRGLKSSIISFDPHPQSFLQKNTPPFRLMTLAQQVKAFEALGVQTLYILRFDQALASLSAPDFAELILKDTLALAHISVGFDFSFGARGLGKPEDLAEWGQDLGFSCDILDCQRDQYGDKLASSQVRDALEHADIEKAAQILSRPQAYEGVVIKGDQKGRTIGFPTLNLDLGAYLRPKYGVYVTKTRFADGQILPSITNIGLRPTVDGLNERFETHVFGLDHEIYGQTVEIELWHYIRPEMKFASFLDLKAQITADSQAAKAFFKIS